jgi:hypothetical protein
MQKPPTKQQITRPLKTRQCQSKTRFGKTKSTARLDHDTPDQTRPEIDEPMKNYRLSGKSFPKQTIPREDMLSRFQNRYFREKTRGRQAENFRKREEIKQIDTVRCSHSVETQETVFLPMATKMIKESGTERA